MMKIPPHLRLSESFRRAREYRLYRLGELIAETGYSVQAVKKPYDLVFSTTRLSDLTNQLRDFQWEWVAETMLSRQEIREIKGVKDEA